MIELINRPMDDPAEAAALVPFCLDCHDENAGIPFSDGQVAPYVDPAYWNNAAHKLGGGIGMPLSCMGDGATFGCHGNAHGSPSVKLLSSGSNVTIDTFCYNCHTDGMIVNNALAGAADDIQEAFGSAERHNLGTSFTVGSNTYTLQCTTCHNPHIATGKHWDVADGVSPITRPDLTADPTTNPRAMGTTLWGAAPGQKMDDYAQLASGTGGWYYSVARGGSLGWDQGGVYQPPKTAGGGWENHEFAGDVLPDYDTFCLDCHTHRMSAANPPVNWGQGIACTGNGVDPPDQRIECGAQHGLGAANKPSAWDPGSTFYGSGGNPDPIFSEPGVQRGRGAGQFMRWPYDSVDRNAGINYVMSCTDCHEAHGSPVGSMLRTTVNNGPGTTVWNNMCNNCHFYYGYQHAGMSCGNASCHEANSIHRIIHNTASGGTYLWTEPSRPDYTPEIDTVVGHIGGHELVVTFAEGVWTTMDQTGAVVPADFLLTDLGGDNPRTITSVAHTPGDTAAIVTMSAPLIEADLATDILATMGVAVWDVDGDPAGPWPVTITGPPRVAITVVEGISGYDQLLVTFSEAVYANTDGTGDLALGDFTLTDIDDGRTITGVTHTAGEAAAELTLSVPLDDTDDIDVDTLAAAADSVHDAYGTPAATGAVVITAMADAPSLLAAQGVDGHDKLAVWFSERVYANPDATGALEPADFDFTDAGSGKSIIAVDHTPGAVTATLTLNGPVDPADVGGATLAPAAGSIYDITGYPADTTEAVLATGLVSSIDAVEGIPGNDTLKVTFQTQVYAHDDETGALGAAAFVLTDVNGNNDPLRSILSVSHTAGNSTAILALSELLDATDLGNDTLAVATDSVFGPRAGSFPLGPDAVTITAHAPPAITNVEGADGFDRLFVSLSEGVFAESNGTGALGLVDFNFADGNSDGAGTIIAVAHTAGDSTAIITVDTPLVAGDIGADTLAAVSDEIFNSMAIPVDTSAVPIAGNDCPAWGTTFPIENEPQYSPTTDDETGLLTGTVGNPTFAFPDADNDWFNGDEVEGTYIDITNNDTCLNSSRAITIEARVKPTEVDRGVGDNTFNRVFERRRTIFITIMNTDYAGDDVPARAGKARVEVKYRVDTASRHTCPHPQWPADPYVGNDARAHQISSDIDLFPIVDNHWYRIKVVFNSDKSDVPGSNGTPVDIYLDDQGVDGLNDPNPTPLDPTLNPDYEQWPGYVNATKAINESSPCRWGALPGDFLEDRSDTSHIGSSWGHNQLFEGQIDWVTWQPVADYSGVDDPPH